MNKYQLTFLDTGRKETTYASSPTIALNWFFKYNAKLPKVGPRTEVRLNIVLANVGKAIRIARYEWETHWQYKDQEYYSRKEDHYQLASEPIPEGWEIYKRDKQNERRPFTPDICRCNIQDGNCQLHKLYPHQEEAISRIAAGGATLPTNQPEFGKTGFTFNSGYKS